MKLKKMEKEEGLKIYESYCPDYFPKDEYKPVSVVAGLWDSGCYAGLGIYDSASPGEEELQGFAFFVKVPGMSTVLLDYYAVLKQYRNDGIGGSFLQLVRESPGGFAGVYLECEDPSCARSPQDKELMSRRIAFYERNGAVLTSIVSRVFGVQYRILYLPCAGASAPSFEEFDLFYRRMFPEEIYRQAVFYMEK